MAVIAEEEEEEEEEEGVNATRPGALFVPFIAAVATAVGVVEVVEVVEPFPFVVDGAVVEEDVRMVYKISSNTEGRSNFSLSNTLMNWMLQGGLGEVKFCLNTISITSPALTPNTISKLFITQLVSKCNELVKGLFSNDRRCMNCPSKKWQGLL